MLYVKREMEMPKAVVFGGGDWEKASLFWELGLSTGACLAANGFEVVTGGYGGAMEAVSCGAAGAGGKTLAFLHAPPEVKPPNEYVRETVVCEDYLDRLAHLLRVPVGIGLPGRSGTLAEIAVALTMLRKHRGRYLAIWRQYWEPRLGAIIGELFAGDSAPVNLLWMESTGQLDEWLEEVVLPGLKSG